MRQGHHVRVLAMVTAVLGIVSCAHQSSQPQAAGARARVRPGITVLMEDSLSLIRGKRIALLTNHTGIDAAGVSDIELLNGPRARAAGVTLVRLFSPEHGIRGTEDREHLESGMDERTGLAVHSLYTSGTIAPPESLLVDLDAFVFDLQDVGTRTWTYTGAMVYSLRAAARRHLPIYVLDRPNPITGEHVDGPVLDTNLSNADEPSVNRPGKAYALYPFPLRHGMTMGELALFYNSVLKINAPLHVIPVTGWRRSMWFDATGLPWVKPSPNLPTLASALVYPSLVAFEGSNLSVGRGTSDAFQRFGAPWLDAPRVASFLNSANLSGARFVVDSFTPVNPGDQKYGGIRIPGVRVDVTDRNRIKSGAIAAAILAAVTRVNRDSLRIAATTFDERFGSSQARKQIVAGDNLETVIRSFDAPVQTFLTAARQFLIYH